MKKKRIIIIAVICVAVIAVVGAVFGVKAYNDYTIQQQTEERIKSIDDTYSKFTKETDRSKKYDILTGFIKDKPSTKDEMAAEVLNSVEPKYAEILGKMQKYFTDDYDKVIKDNTIDSKTLSKTDDKKKLQGYIDNLNSLKKTIDSEKGSVFFENDKSNASTYTKKADELIKSYTDRIETVKKAEAETKAKKEAEAKKKAEEKAKAEKNNSNNSSSSSSSESESNNYNDNNSYNDNNNDYNYNYNDNNSSGNNYNYDSGNSSSSSDSGSSHGDWVNRYGDDENGYTYDDGNGTAWDDSGTTWNYKDLWESTN